MTPSKRKGTAFEVAVRDYLRTAGLEARRQAPSGPRDEGDLDVPVWEAIVECKATRAIELAHTLDEAELEANQAGVRYGIAIIKRRLRPVEDAYVVMSLAEFVEFTHGR